MEMGYEGVELAGGFHACACIGKFRGSVSDEPGCTWKDIYEVMSRIGEAAARQKVTGVVEPQNPDSINNLNTIGEALNWLSELKNPQVHLLADTFHMEYTEENTAESITESTASTNTGAGSTAVMWCSVRSTARGIRREPPRCFSIFLTRGSC